MATAKIIEGLGERSGWRRTLAYGLAHYGKSLCWTAGELLLAYFLTEVAGLTPIRMGVILAAGLAVSAVADLAVGFLLGQRLSSLRKAVHLQFVGAIVSSIAMLALFASDWAPPSERAAYALTVSVVFRISYALYDLPQNALISLAAPDDRGRSRLAATRYVFGGIANLTVAGLTPLLLLGSVGAEAARFFGLAALFSVIAVGSAALLKRALRASSDSRSPPVLSKLMSSQDPLRGALVLLVALMFIQSLAGPVFSKIEPYYAAYVLHSRLLSIGVLAGVALGTSLSQPLWLSLSANWSRPATIGLTALAVVLSALVFLAFGPFGGLIAALCSGAFGAASGGLGMAIWAAYGDVVATQGRGREALSFALFTAASKAALALGALVIGVFLARINYRSDRYALTLAMSTPAIVAAGLCAVIAWIWTLRRAASAGALARRAVTLAE